MPENGPVVLGKDGKGKLALRACKGSPPSISLGKFLEQFKRDKETDLEHLFNLGRLFDPHSRNVDHGRLVEFRSRVVDVQVRPAEHEPVLAPFAACRVA